MFVLMVGTRVVLHTVPGYGDFLREQGGLHHVVWRQHGVHSWNSGNVLFGRAFMCRVD